MGFNICDLGLSWPVHGSHTKIIWNCLRASIRAKLSAIGIKHFRIKRLLNANVLRDLALLKTKPEAPPPQIPIIVKCDAAREGWFGRPVLTNKRPR